MSKNPLLIIHQTVITTINQYFMKKIIFWLSITFNIFFVLLYFWNKINSPSHELGILKEDIEVGNFMGENCLFKIPKGITVRNESECGISAIGQFENKRFSIIITADKDLINYNVENADLNRDGNYYSADFKKFVENFE